MVPAETPKLVRNCLCDSAKRLHRSDCNQRSARGDWPQCARCRRGNSSSRSRISPRCHPHSDDVARACRFAGESFRNLENPKSTQQASRAVAATTRHGKKNLLRTLPDCSLDTDAHSSRGGVDYAPHGPSHPVVRKVFLSFPEVRVSAVHVAVC